MSAADPRARLDAREGELVAALRGGAAPSGLDARMVALASAGITRKRARQVARAFPALARDLGTSFQERFIAFADDHPPIEGGELADGIAFGRLVARETPLSRAATTELLLARASVVVRDGGVRPRRHPHLVLGRSERRAVPIVVVRLPLLGVRVLVR